MATVRPRKYTKVTTTKAIALPPSGLPDLPGAFWVHGSRVTVRYTRVWFMLCGLPNVIPNVIPGTVYRSTEAIWFYAIRFIYRKLYSPRVAG